MRIEVAVSLVARRFLVAALGLAAAGCASTVPFDRGVLAYDRATAAIISRELLLNIARARQDQPMHFTAISNITATYRLSFSAGITPALTGDRGLLLAPLLGGSRAPPSASFPCRARSFRSGS